eukprot:CAMPEP_0197836154 /NCGR_PEP_ID=MMETSP1437-20131217/28129_1 /TAXON_ID=49252 ORGANISM="Eucampia antarctica, Strain CCMP1452" /NCGR_SAMPLE_ID=MMETSP1437 /ASSEMBLY_ACC=CAM_ASM_001096 /LENGTH=225 /DNA_ID=CAMNT_0043442115 /DNA_START=153 /DNA_END=831 /DNA_ORIENTATION=-
MDGKKVSEDDVYAFPNSGVQVKILKKINRSIANDDDDEIETEHYSYYSGEGSGVKVNYSAKLVDGSTVISNQELVMNQDNMLAGFEEALEAMMEGEIWELYVPSTIGNRVLSDNNIDSTIPKGQALIFTVELMEIMDDELSKISIKEFSECNPNKLRGCQDWELTYAKKLNLECDHDYDCLLVEEMELKKWTGNKSTKELDGLNQKRLRILKKLLTDADEHGDEL